MIRKQCLVVRAPRGRIEERVRAQKVRAKRVKELIIRAQRVRVSNAKVKENHFLNLKRVENIK
jgi:hypothetical protein